MNAKECPNCGGKMRPLDMHGCLQHPTCRVFMWHCLKCHRTATVHYFKRRTLGPIPIRDGQDAGTPMSGAET